MRFKFCGDADCPDWVLVEINTLSRLSSIKLKLLAQVVAQGLINPPIDFDKAEKMFSESKLDADVDLRACIACISYILTSAVKFNCDSNSLQNELQQLGLPREHSTSLKRVVDDQAVSLTEKLKQVSLRVNALEYFSASVNHDLKCANIDLKINGGSHNLTLSRKLVDVFLESMEEAKKMMVELKEAS